MIVMNRRSLITGLVSLMAAPAIVRAGSLMPVKLYDLGPDIARGSTLPPFITMKWRLVILPTSGTKSTMIQYVEGGIPLIYEYTTEKPNDSNKPGDSTAHS